MIPDSAKYWRAERSGTKLSDGVAAALESFVAGAPLSPMILDDIAGIEFECEYIEGEQRQRLTNYYERDPQLRAAAIRIHGTRCQVCSFDFEEHYGVRGSGYIEVHHKTMVSRLGRAKVDPRRDMAVLCSNCHRMIHRRTNAPLTIEQFRKVRR